MTPPLLRLPDPQTCQHASLREVLEVLLAALAFQGSMPPETPDVLRPLYDAQWAIDNAYAVLAQDTNGVEAQQEIRLHMTLALLGYEFASYLEGVQAAGITLPAEIRDALAEVQVLTQASYGEAAHETA